MPDSIRTAIAALVVFMAVMSCVENDRTLGEQFVSSDYLLSVDSHSFNVPIRQRVHDTVQGISYNRMMVGYISDTTYGSTVVDGASFVIPIPDSAYLGINPRLKDVYLDLVIDSSLCYTPGADATPQNIYLYEIVKKVLSDSSMMYNNSLRLAPDCLSEEPISIGSPMLFGPSTVRIGLTKEYGEKLLATSPGEFKELLLFLDRVYGIYIASDKPDREKVGGRLNYVSLSSSIITVEYIMNDPEQNIVDRDTTVTFLFGYGYAVNQFSAGTRSLETENPGDILYMDGLSGVKPVIPGLELKDCIDGWAKDVCAREGCEKESILLSQAKLVFPYDMPEDFETFEVEHPTKIFPFWTNVGAIDSTVRMWPGVDIYRSSGGSMDRSHCCYCCDVTSAIQEMITEDRDSITQKDDMWICPVSTTTNSSTSTVTYDFDADNYHRVILKGPESERAPRLELVYGVLKDW